MASPKKLHCVWVSTTVKPVTQIAETAVKNASKILTLSPEELAIGILRRTVPRAKNRQIREPREENY